ncbi:hypothetical protein QYF61_001478 [Mycteria americana]|uniref:Uncharacterized protein n=1 Tax=Mycteria americana TaxID=33587 RepID=A0AAN7P2U4_MYCAM|nr:hypothetical protein QYF61_001478 [Mycteria americana]
MATDEVTGGARKATKSKLFEFLVHGVIYSTITELQEPGLHTAFNMLLMNMLKSMSPSKTLHRPGMPSGARMPHQGAPMGPPGPPYVGSPSVRPGMPQTVMETTRKRTAPQQVQQQQVQQQVQQQQQATQNRTRRVVANRLHSTGETVTSRVLQGSVLAAVQFSIFINDLEEAVECVLIKIADDTKSRGEAGTSGKALVDSELSMSKICALAAKMTNSILGCMNRSTAKRLRDLITPAQYSSVLSFETSNSRKTLANWTGSPLEVGQRAGSAHEERLKELALFCVEQGWL